MAVNQPLRQRLTIVACAIHKAGDHMSMRCTPMPHDTDVVQALAPAKSEHDLKANEVEAAQAAVKWLIDNGFVRGLDCAACHMKNSSKVRPFSGGCGWLEVERCGVGGGRGGGSGGGGEQGKAGRAWQGAPFSWCPRAPPGGGRGEGAAQVQGPSPSGQHSDGMHLYLARCGDDRTHRPGLCCMVCVSHWASPVLTALSYSWRWLRRGRGGGVATCLSSTHVALRLRHASCGVAWLKAAAARCKHM